MRPLLLLLLGLAACGPDRPDNTFAVRGVYHGTRFGGAAVSVTHEAAPAHDMAAMRMDLRLADGADAGGLAPGTTVTLTLRDTDGRIEVLGLAPLPDTARADLPAADFHERPH